MLEVVAVVDEQARVRIEAQQYANTFSRQHEHGVLPALVDEAFA